MLDKIIQIEQMEYLPALFGNLDKNINLIQRKYDISISSHDAGLKVSGDDENVKLAVKVLELLVSLIQKGQSISEQDVFYCMSLAETQNNETIQNLSESCICMTVKGKPISPKTLGQKAYCKAIKENTITIGIGPAGTGKTYLAVAMAVNALKKRDVDRIVLTRPAVEAGEQLGFLPGDLQQKVDPYLRPVSDALFDMLGSEAYQKYSERGNIEIAPLAYMRGRTLDHSFIILDEAQNTTPQQMKMFLTRLGFASKMVITGDITQQDISREQGCGLTDAAHILRDIDDIAQVFLDEKDVVRHRLVQEIIKAYEKTERKCDLNGRKN